MRNFGSDATAPRTALGRNRAAAVASTTRMFADAERLTRLLLLLGATLVAAYTLPLIASFVG